MEETPEHITSYKTGFNEGYLIAKHEPDLSEKIGAIKSQTPRLEGMNDGRREYILEQIKEMHASRSPKEHLPGKTKGKDKSDLDLEK